MTNGGSLRLLNKGLCERAVEISAARFDRRTPLGRAGRPAKINGARGRQCLGTGRIAAGLEAGDCRASNMR